MAWRRSLSVLLMCGACGGEDAEETLAPPPAATGCPAGSLTLEDGRCQAAGVPAEACASGFEADGSGGCRAILPPAICREGTMALPGETQCREVAPCAVGRWGDIPIDANTEHVDIAYAASDSDGSIDKPWTSVQAAIDAASPGAIVAIAEGIYVEDLFVANKPVRLWGVCPRLVTVQGAGADVAITLSGLAVGSEVRHLSVRGPGGGIGALAEGITIEGVWAHALGNYGVVVMPSGAPAGATVEGSLIEGATHFGVVGQQAHVIVASTVVRGTRLLSGDWGMGIGAQTNAVVPGSRSNLEVRGSVVELNHVAGIFVLGSDAVIESTLVRDTQPGTVSSFGKGVEIASDVDTGERAVVSLRSSVIERSSYNGVSVGASDATIEATVVRDTSSRASDGLHGYGMHVADDLGVWSNVSIRTSLVERSHAAGIFVSDSDATIEGTLIRDTLAEDATLAVGRGLNIQTQSLELGRRTTALVRGCAVERSVEAGITTFDANTTIESTWVHDTYQRVTDNRFGFGIQLFGTPGIATESSVVGALVEQSAEVGVVVVSTTASIDASTIAGTRSNHGFIGDGIAIVAKDAPAMATVRKTSVLSPERAGISCFGCTAAIASVHIDCAAIGLSADVYHDSAPRFVDEGGNTCGCGPDTGTCKVLTPNLQPPEALQH